ncbi:MAG: biopolymer transporter ExbD [Kofleriaceae bacterium]|nr:biopolymer transporter ExbD [Kofleriaceae bacterium]MCB9570631.1 biopolymer transporter ExbD [Kofleriaceae bacterium]
MAGGSLYDGDEDDAITGINVTPLVDVVLVLLVIFMVTARLIVGRGVDVSRPKAATGGQVSSNILVSVDKDGVLYVNGDAQPDAASATARIKVLLETSPDAKAIIDGDAAAAYGGVMRAIDVVTAAGIEKIALANAPLPAGTAP